MTTVKNKNKHNSNRILHEIIFHIVEVEIIDIVWFFESFIINRQIFA